MINTLIAIASKSYDHIEEFKTLREVIWKIYYVVEVIPYLIMFNEKFKRFSNSKCYFMYLGFSTDRNNYDGDKKV